MNWIIFFTKYKIPYQVYKLRKGDSIILSHNTQKNNSMIIILTGIVSLIRIFYTKEFLPLAILSKNNIIYESTNETKYYQITALKTTYIIKVKENNLYKQKINNNYKKTITKYYNKTFKRYEETISILNQSSKRNRVVLFILFIFLRFGTVKEHNIVIPFELEIKCISTMTTTGKETINKIIRKKQISKKGKLQSISIKKLKLV